jgi:hypothetical protein
MHFILVLKIVKERDIVTCQLKYSFLYLIMLLPVSGIVQHSVRNDRMFCGMFKELGWKRTTMTNLLE